MPTERALKFHDNCLGMFIHWGIYAQLGVQEQVFARYDLPRAEYEGYAHTFCPTRYDPEAWVLMAKHAGMRYICFTTKHHDGFCMWDTKQTDYSIMHTPYGRDVLRMLADACAKHGMRLSLYYSCPDWHHENGFNRHSTHQGKAHFREDNDYSRYIDYVKRQVTELLTNYGPIYTFFWDIPPQIYDPSVNELVRSLQTEIYINNRGFDPGDFSTPEREYGTIAGQRFAAMTEACNSVGEQSWGYRSNEDYFSVRYLTQSIDRVMAMGGNYLLNVGPDGNGEIPPEAADRIARVGDWYRRMQGCLESADADDFPYEIKKAPFLATQKNGKSYFHFYQGLNSSAVAFAHYPRLPRRVTLMNTGAPLPFAEAILPEYTIGQAGVAGKFLHIQGIPVDDLQSEPIVLEIAW